MLKDVSPPLDETVFADKDKWCSQQDSVTTLTSEESAKIVVRARSIIHRNRD